MNKRGDRTARDRQDDKRDGRTRDIVILTKSGSPHPPRHMRTMTEILPTAG